MCVILDIKAGATIPPDMLAQACDINKHGFGLSFVNTKKQRIMTLKVQEQNDPVKIAKHLSDYNAHRVFLHLRHATVGAEYLADNSHPFYALDHSKAGMELCLMHNGTLYDYTPKDKALSDTYIFNEHFLRPLSERVYAFSGKKMLADKFFLALISQEAKQSSVMLLFDNIGNVARINENKGKVYDWGWASNDYSFDKQHVRSSTRTVYSYGHGYTGNYSGGFQNQQKAPEMPWEDADARDSLGWSAWDDAFVFEQGGEVAVKPKLPETPVNNTTGWMKKVSALSNTAGSVSDLVRRHQQKSVKQMIDSAIVDWPTGKSIMTREGVVTQVLDQKRKTFKELVGIEDLSFIGALTKPNLVEICDAFPDTAAELIIDLFAHYQETKVKP